MARLIVKREDASSRVSDYSVEISDDELFEFREAVDSLPSYDEEFGIADFNDILRWVVIKPQPIVEYGNLEGIEVVYECFGKVLCKVQDYKSLAKSVNVEDIGFSVRVSKLGNSILLILHCWDNGTLVYITRFELITS